MPFVLILCSIPDRIVYGVQVIVELCCAGMGGASYGPSIAGVSDPSCLSSEAATSA